MDTKQIAIQAIDQNKDLFCQISDKIWEFAELSLMEYQSADLLCQQFKADGWEVEQNLDNIATCFKASFGHGKPYIGILGEFDALSGLSQVGGATQRQELIKDGCGHGCGHNMLGAGSMAAAYGVRAYLEQTGKQGTVIYFGCPGEEGGASKAFLARDGYWKFLDVALCWHPSDVNQVFGGSSNSCIQKEYCFTGVAAHAAGSPQYGRSALDAVELMNMGVQFLREHMDSHDRIHYAITDAGGNSPNVVQPHARVLYMVRSHQVQDCIALQKRVDKIATAAAMMTETDLHVRFIDGLANLITNQTLEHVIYNNLQYVGCPTYTDQEMEYAKELLKSVENPTTGLPQGMDENDPRYQEVDTLSNHGTKPLNDFIVPYLFSNDATPGSTDVGDVSWLTPTAQVNTVCFASNAPGHSWQNVSIGKTSIGHKGLIYAGKVLACTAIDLFENPDIVAAARAEFEKKTAVGFTSPIPPDAVPTTV